MNKFQQKRDQQRLITAMCLTFGVVLVAMALFGGRGSGEWRVLQALIGIPVLVYGVQRWRKKR